MLHAAGQRDLINSESPHKILIFNIVGNVGTCSMSSVSANNSDNERTQITSALFVYGVLIIMSMEKHKTMYLILVVLW